MKPIADPPADPTAERSAALKEELASFRLLITYGGDQDKPFYQLALRTAGAPTDDKLASSFNLEVKITDREAERLIEGLAREGFLRRAKAGKAKLDASLSGYVLIVENDRFSQYESLGSPGDALPHLKSLRKLIDGDAAKAMDRLLARLTGFEKK